MPGLFERPRKRRANVDPGEVFTPAKPVQRDMWASRTLGDLQRRFEQRVVESGRQIVLYGDTGVGKTSLVQHICDTSKISMVHVESGQPFDEMLKEALASAGITEDRFEAIEKSSGQAGVRGSLVLLYSRWQRSDEDKLTKTSYPVSLATTARVALSAAGVKILFIDNFENLRAKSFGDEVATEVVQLMKSFSDRGDVKVVVAGIPAASERLLLLDEATARRTSEIEVPRMSDEELDEILRKGETKLDLSFDADCRTAILRYSDGFPYYTHLLALHSARAALSAGDDRVSMPHFESALGDVLDDADLSLKRAYADAAETAGGVKVRKSIMLAMAREERQEITFGQIKVAFKRIHPSYELDRLNFINPGLGELVERYGVLQSRGVARSADRTYRFANPLMRSYVKLRAAQEDRVQLRLDLDNALDDASTSDPSV